MPNCVYNIFHIEKQYLSNIVNSENEVDFNIVKPMPESLNCEASSMNDLAIYYYLSDRMSVPVDDMRKSKLVNTLLSNKFIADYIGVIEHRLTEALSENSYYKYKFFEDGKTLVDNYSTYDATTWYDWSIANWGCKWNAGTESIEDDPDDNNFVIATFNTPWSPPEGWLKTLTDMGIPFSCEWHDEGGESGEFISDGSGELKSVEFEYSDED